MKRSLVIICTMLMLAGMACRDNETNPSEGSTVHPDYSWTAETLSYPGSFQTSMQAMYGTSAINIYIVGHNERGFGKMYHYDGVHWNNVGLSISEGGTITRPIDLTDIHGTSTSNIWAVGGWLALYFDSTRNTYVITDSSLAIHYDGTSWREYPVEGGDELFGVWVISAVDAWAVGGNSSVFHFDGSRWKKYVIDGNYFISSVCATSTSDVYFVGNRSANTPPIDSSGYFLFHFDGTSWSKVDSVMEIPDSPLPRFGRGLWFSGSTLYSLGGSGIYRREGTSWKQISDVEAGHMYYSDANNIIAVGRSVYSFNGSAWKDYSQFNVWPAMSWFDCYSAGKDAFVVGNNNSVTVILHGRQ